VEIERGSTLSHSVENSLRKRLRTRRKADYGMSFPVGRSWIEKGQIFFFFVRGIESRSILCPAHSLAAVLMEV